MTATLTVEPKSSGSSEPQSLAADRVPAAPAVGRKPMGLFFWVAVSWMALVVFMAVFADLLPLKDPQDQDYAALVAKGSQQIGSKSTAAHWLGTDNLGRDLLARLAFGGRASMLIGLATIVFGFLIGGVLGMVAGYFRGRKDNAMSFLVTVLQSFPPLMLLLLMVTFLGRPSTVKLTLALGILSVPNLFRVVRAATLQFSGREFVLAARAMGASSSRILFREILPNVAKPMLAFGLVGVGTVMVVEGTVSFLGYGVPAPTPAWGTMIQEARNKLEANPYYVFLPCIVLFLTVLSFNFIGDKLRERFEVKQGGI